MKQDCVEWRQHQGHLPGHVGTFQRTFTRWLSPRLMTPFQADWYGNFISTCISWIQLLSRESWHILAAICIHLLSRHDHVLSFHEKKTERPSKHISICSPRVPFSIFQLKKKNVGRSKDVVQAVLRLMILLPGLTSNWITNTHHLIQLVINTLFCVLGTQ